MALPKSTETDRTVHLRNIVHTTGSEEVFSWPKPNDDDLALFGRVIGLYCIIDFHLRYVAEIMDNSGMLASPWKGKTPRLNMHKVMRAIRSSQIWNEGHIVGFDEIEKHRSARNLIAHFVVRRFPAEDAYIFMTKSASDFEQVYGVLPEPDSMLFGVIDAAQMRGLIPVLLGLVSWLSKLPRDLSRPLKPDV